MSDLTQSRLMHLLAYDPETGVFTWRVSPTNGVRVGTVAGGKRSDGYHQINIDGKHYRAHRLAWLYIHGHFPGLIDHLNGIRADNRITNLRDVDCSINSQNQRRAQSANKSGLLGVCWHKCNAKWRAQIRLDGRKKHLGLFATADEAHAAYLEAKRLHHRGCTI